MSTVPRPGWSVGLRSSFRTTVLSNSYYEMKHSSISMRKQSNCCFQSCCFRWKATVIFSVFIQRLIHVCPIVWTCVRRLFFHTKIKSASSWGTNHVFWRCHSRAKHRSGVRSAATFFLLVSWVALYMVCLHRTYPQCSFSPSSTGLSLSGTSGRKAGRK